MRALMAFLGDFFLYPLIKTFWEGVGKGMGERGGQRVIQIMEPGDRDSFWARIDRKLRVEDKPAADNCHRQQRMRAQGDPCPWRSTWKWNNNPYFVPGEENRFVTIYARHWDKCVIAIGEPETIQHFKWVFHLQDPDLDVYTEGLDNDGFEQFVFRLLDWGKRYGAQAMTALDGQATKISQATRPKITDGMDALNDLRARFGLPRV